MTLLIAFRLNEAINCAVSVWLECSMPDLCEDECHLSSANLRKAAMVYFDFRRGTFDICEIIDESLRVYEIWLISFILYYIKIILTTEQHKIKQHIIL